MDSQWAAKCERPHGHCPRPARCGPSAKQLPHVLVRGVLDDVSDDPFAKGVVDLNIRILDGLVQFLADGPGVGTILPRVHPVEDRLEYIDPGIVVARVVQNRLVNGLIGHGFTLAQVRSKVNPRFGIRTSSLAGG